MEGTEYSGGTFDGAYNKLISPEELSTDENSLYSNEDKQQGMGNELKVNSWVQQESVFLSYWCQFLTLYCKVVLESYYCANLYVILIVAPSFAIKYEVLVLLSTHRYKRETN